MFTKKADRETVAFEPPRSQSVSNPSLQTAAPRRRQQHQQQQAKPGGVSQISADLTIIGNLVSKGEVQIDGEVQGDLHASTIVVGENARIAGSVVADEVVVRGTVMGSVHGKRVHLQATSKVDGDVYHQQLAIEQGAYFEGKSRRVEDPTAGVPRPELMMPPNGHAGAVG